MLVTLDSVLSATDIARLRPLLDAAPWTDGQRTAGSQARHVKHNDQLPSDCETAAAVRQAVLQALDCHARFFSAALPKKVFTPRINRYQGSGHYGMHYDNAVMRRADGQQVRSDVSCTVFLNEPDEYEGGELVIHDTYGEQRVKLAAGSAVLYPGTSLHEVRPVTQGQRLACFFWIESMVRSDPQRALLHELDMAITSLRAQHGETPQTHTLTGTYHNLLRMWADT